MFGPASKPVIPPGCTIGILGGGQLGRMFAIAARRMGYRVHAFDPTGDCPTGQVADVEVNAPYDDLAAAVAFARAVDVVTFEFENIPAETLAAIEAIRPVRPSAAALEVCRHRLREKQFLLRHGFPLADHRAVQGPQDVAEALAELGTPAVLKTADFGYDGKGQVKLTAQDTADPRALANAWATMGRPVGVVESWVNFAGEASVIVARSLAGQTSCFAMSANTHRNHILDTSVVPAGWPDEVADQARRLAVAVTEALGVVGLLTVEMFVLDDPSAPGGYRLLVNELAPRPHNSGHLTMDATTTCQFEQQLRAVCGLPLGAVEPLAPAAAMANLLGDLWQAGEPNWAAALADPSVKLHLYGKAQARPGRKMGHLTATAPTPQAALATVVAARQRLASPAPSLFAICESSRTA